MSARARLYEGIDRDTIRGWSRRSDGRGGLQLGFHLLLLAASTMGVALSRGHPWLFPALVLQGVVLAFLFCALHETIHASAFASRGANDALAFICGMLLVLPPQYFRWFHFAHHRFTQDPRLDPELAQPPTASLRTYLWRVSGLPNWARRLTITLRHAGGTVREPFVPPAKRAMIVLEARIFWLCYAALFALSLAFRRTDALLYWLVPVMLGQPFLRLFLMAEHAGCAMNDDPFANTRTTDTNAAVRLLTWQMSFHVEHHAFPGVPFHALPAVHAHLADRIEVKAAGYLAVHGELLRRLCRSGATTPDHESVTGV